MLQDISLKCGAEAGIPHGRAAAGWRARFVPLLSFVVPGMCWEVPGSLAQMQAGWMKEIPLWWHRDRCCLPLGLGVERHQGMAGSEGRGVGALWGWLLHLDCWSRVAGNFILSGVAANPCGL